MVDAEAVENAKELYNYCTARVDRYGNDACKVCPFIVYVDNGFSLENCVINYPRDWDIAGND
jgi:hypothetical protein